MDNNKMWNMINSAKGNKSILRELAYITAGLKSEEHLKKASINNALELIDSVTEYGGDGLIGRLDMAVFRADMDVLTYVMDMEGIKYEILSSGKIQVESIPCRECGGEGVYELTEADRRMCSHISNERAAEVAGNAWKQAVCEECGGTGFKWTRN